MLSYPQANEPVEIRMYSITLNRPRASTSNPNRRSVRALFLCLSYAVSCQPLPADEDEQGGPSSTETSSLLSAPGDLADPEDARSRKSAHSHCVDVTGLALLHRPDFWQLWILMGLLTGVGLMTIK